MKFAAQTVKPQTPFCVGRGAPIRNPTSRRMPFVPRGQGAAVDFGGELHSVVESLAHNDEILRHFSVDDGAPRSRAKLLGDIMQVNLITASPNTTLNEAEERLKGIEGLPVVDDSGKLVGVLSRKDLKKGGSVVRDVMTSPPIALGATDKAFVAGHTMLDNKIHRVPIVDEDGKAIGIVTRTDLFWALASQSDRAQWFSEHGIDL